MRENSFLFTENPVLSQIVRELNIPCGRVLTAVTDLALFNFETFPPTRETWLTIKANPVVKTASGIIMRLGIGKSQPMNVVFNAIVKFH
jgi:hypothetical protein